MASGYDVYFRVTGSSSEEPPVSYSLGLYWTSGNQTDFRLDVSLDSGLDALRTAYSGLPGLGGHRELWLRATLSGANSVAKSAAELLLSRYSAEKQKKCPVFRRDHGATVGEWIRENRFPNGEEMAGYAGVYLNSLFLDYWESLAIAAEEWPRARWGVCPKVTTLKVHDLKGNELGRQDACRVLDIAERYSRDVNVGQYLGASSRKFAPMVIKMANGEQVECEDMYHVSKFVK